MLGFAVLWLWEQILHMFLSTDEVLLDDGWDSDNYRRAVLILGIVILGADAMTFYVSMAQFSWSGSEFSLPALLTSVRRKTHFGPVSPAISRRCFLEDRNGSAARPV